MTGSTHALSSRAKVVALLLATALLAGWTLVAASGPAPAGSHSQGTSTQHQALGKWPVTKYGKKW